MEAPKKLRKQLVKKLRGFARLRGSATAHGAFIICDNESFLKTRAAERAHGKTNVELWHVPARSPDLNPVEMYWAKIRLWLRKMDLDDLRKGRRPVDKGGLQQRVRRLLQTAKAKGVAISTFSTLRRECVAVIKKKGAAIRV